MSNGYADELAFARELSLRAGEVVMGWYDQGGGDVGDKDGEPVTEADRAANDLITNELASRYPLDAILAEETPVENDRWSRSERCWVVDPLDGTSDFVAGREGFAVMIGLLVRGVPKVGAVHVPKAGRTFLGVVGEGAEEERGGERHVLKTSARSKTEELRVICSIAHRDAALERALDLLKPGETLSVGSVGYKVGKIVADEADLYIATTNRISLWDTAGPQAILHAAGGAFLDLDGNVLGYGGPHLNHPRGLLATNGACREDVTAKLGGAFDEL